MSDGRILKPDKDFSKEADKQIPEAQELANVTFLVARGSNAHRLLTGVLDQCSSSNRETFST